MRPFTLLVVPVVDLAKKKYNGKIVGTDLWRLPTSNARCRLPVRTLAVAWTTGREIPCGGWGCRMPLM